ncbi:MAG TPA: hypothetical protein VLD37_01215 [Candidatus Bilamarchaeum sp.]|nr:hypothetical protein [Candidatus Bilamarchaeum sp.]
MKKRMAAEKPATNTAKAATSRSAEGAAVFGSALPPDKAAELVSDLESDELSRSLVAAAEIIENYRAVAGAAAVNPELNMTRINVMLNDIFEKNISKIVEILSEQGLRFLAESSVISSMAVKDAAKKRLMSAQ